MGRGANLPCAAVAVVVAAAVAAVAVSYCSLSRHYGLMLRHIRQLVSYLTWKCSRSGATRDRWLIPSFNIWCRLLFIVTVLLPIQQTNEMPGCERRRLVEILNYMRLSAVLLASWDGDLSRDFGRISAIKSRWIKPPHVQLWHIKHGRKSPEIGPPHPVVTLVN